MWRYDAGRTAATPHELPAALHLQWVRAYPKPTPAWPDQPRLKFDHEYRPVVMGKTMFVSSPGSDWVAALDTETGAEKWRTYTDGPVRFAPVARRGKVYAASDDGHLYCLDAATGRTVWRVPGAPGAGRKVLGNRRLISTWPARGGPVLAHGRLYFAAGIWPFMGVFVRAVDPGTGRTVWCNSGSGSKLRGQPHCGEAFTGPAPQGYLAVNGDRLLVPNGRGVAACFDAHTGGLRYFRIGSTRAEGSCFVATGDRFYFNRKTVFEAATGRRLGRVLGTPVLTDRAIYSGNLAYDVKRAAPFTYTRGEKTLVGIRLPKLWQFAGARIGKVWLKAGGRLYATSGSDVVALELGADGPPKLVWRMEMKSAPASMLAADGKLFVVTASGDLLCFGAKKTSPRVHLPFKPTLRAPDSWARRAAQILRAARAKAGYCVVVGLTPRGRLVEELARQSDLHVIAVERDAGRVDAVRRRLDAAGLYGPRVAVHRGDLASLRLPPYLARLVVCEALPPADGDPGARFLREAFRVLRPYGGVACLSVPKARHGDLAKWLAGAGLAGAELRRSGERTLLLRKGPLPGAGSWTHQNGDVANTVFSADDRVKAPLGLLWFGGSSNTGMLPRHGHGPTPQVVGGRIVIEGVDKLRAMDVYTGRVLWETELPGLGELHDIEYHQAGANNLGGNCVSLADGVYVVYKDRCLRLNPATGRKLREFALPRARGAGAEPTWGYVGVWKNILLAGADTQELYDPDFSSREFPTLAEKPERTAALKAWVAGLVAWMKTLKDFEPLPKGANGTDSHWLAANLNKLLRERKLVARLPGSLTPGRRQVQDQIDLYLRGKPGVLPDDFRLRGLNRALLRQFNGRIPHKRPGKPGSRKSWTRASSRRLVAMDRYTGKVLWTLPARQGFLHNAIVAGGGRVFCIDRFPPALHDLMTFSGRDPGPGRLLAVDAQKGTVMWKVDQGVFGTWLGYSDEHGALLQAKRPSRDSVDGSAGRRLAVFRGRDGKKLWDKDIGYYGGPCILHGRRVITQGRDCKGEAWDLLTGARRTRINPLTGRTVRWRFKRSYGCGTALASRHLLTFRSGSCGFYDLLRDGGTGNLGGFRSGCTSNMIVADGVLAVPDYTRSCSCSYTNQASVGLIHDPDVEMWTYQRFWNGQAPIRRIGLNFGAPGDRRADDGTFWLDWPSIGGDSPNIPVTAEPESPGRFRGHASEIRGGGHAWVAASGLTGVRKLTLHLGEGARRPYTIRLYFAEPEAQKPGGRVFSVAIQGRRVLTDFDVLKAAGGHGRAVVREFKGIQVTDVLTLGFDAKVGAALICGIEIVAERP